MRHGWALVAAAVLLTAQPAVAAKTRTVRLKTPGYGNVTLASVATPPGTRKQAKRPLFSGARSKSFPSSVRVLTLTRRYRVKGGKWRRAGLVMIINRKPPAAGRALAHQDPDKDNFNIFIALVLAGFDVSNDPLFTNPKPKRQPSVKQLINAAADSEAANQTLGAKAGIFSADFLAEPISNSAWQTLSKNDPSIGAPDLETHHYDDGHAFGWKLTSESEARLWRDVINDITKKNFDELRDHIEERIQADVDADGVIGAAATGCTGEATADFDLVIGNEEVKDYTFPSVIPAACDLGTRSSGGASRWSAVVHDQRDPATIYFCHQGIDMPKGEAACTSPQPAFPPGGDLIQDIVKQDGAYMLGFRFSTRQPQTLPVRVHYAWKG